MTAPREAGPFPQQYPYGIITIYGMIAYIELYLGIWDRCFITIVSGLLHASLIGTIIAGNNEVMGFLGGFTGVVAIYVGILQTLSDVPVDLRICTFVIAIGWILLFTVVISQQISQAYG